MLRSNVEENDVESGTFAVPYEQEEREKEKEQEKEREGEEKERERKAPFIDGTLRTHLSARDLWNIDKLS